MIYIYIYIYYTLHTTIYYNIIYYHNIIIGLSCSGRNPEVRWWG